MCNLFWYKDIEGNTDVDEICMIRNNPPHIPSDAFSNYSTEKGKCTEIGRSANDDYLKVEAKSEYDCPDICEKTESCYGFHWESIAGKCALFLKENIKGSYKSDETCWIKNINAAIDGSYNHGNQIITV